MNSEQESGPFQITAANVAFAVLPGLVLMFTLAPAAVPAVPLAFSGFFCAFIGAMLGLVVYRQVKDYGPLARIGALTVLLAVLYLGSVALVG
jgi:uncharacterized membrane protein YeaQ/YmgE (transglycosylase-associated protein family)